MLCIHLLLYVPSRYSRFSSFNQQDSEEVLRCLLDGIRMEEIEVFIHTYIIVKTGNFVWLPINYTV